MLRLVEGERRATRQSDLGEHPPSLVTRRPRDRRPGRGQLAQRLVEVVTRHVEPVHRLTISRMDRNLSRRELEKEPILAGVDTGKADPIAKEGSIGFGV